MDQKVTFAQPAARQIVYIRAVAVADLPKDLRDQSEGLKNIYAVHDSDGQRLALVRDRQTAFYLARENEMHPVHTH